jgi:hypothetical protein
LPAASTVRRIENTGVMPEPPANMMKSPSSDFGVNMPAGGATSSVSPARRLVHSQAEARPSASRLTVTRVASAAMAGEPDSE